MSVVGTIVANVVANIDKFESGMKRAASIHQSTVKQINSGQMLKGYNNADDWWKGITSAQRSSNSSYQKELAAALDGNQQQIASKAESLGRSIGQKVTKGSSSTFKIADLTNLAVLTGGFSVAATGALSLASAYDELQKSNWISKNAEQLAAYNQRLSEAVEMIGKLSTNTKLADSIRGAIAFGAPLSGVSGRLAADLSSGKQSRLAAGLFEFDNNAQKLIQGQEATLTPGQFLQNADEKRARLEAQSRFAKGKLGTLSEFTFARTGFADKYNAYAGGNMDNIRAYNAAVKEFEQLLQDADKPLVAFNEAIAEFKVNAVDAAQSLATELPAMKNRIMGGKSVFEMANDLTASGGRSIFEGGLGGLKDLAKTLTDPTARGRMLGESLPAGEALKAELARIDGMKNLRPEDANLLRGTARNRFASQLGSGFNQTRLFGAMAAGSSAAISAINEAQNRIKSPEEMTLNEQLEESKRQTKLLEKIGERTVIEAKAAGFN
jgi:exonuclease VII small subunit